MADWPEIAEIAATLFGASFVYVIIDWAIDAKNPLKRLIFALLLAPLLSLLIAGPIFLVNWLLALLAINPYYQGIRDGLPWIAGLIAIIIFGSLLFYELTPEEEAQHRALLRKMRK
jgi:hypothetical protein